jgi:hypothetical protein
MRECQMQVSGPWPPYHFVHRLTRAAAHATAQPTAAHAAPAPSRMAAMPEAIPAMA